MKWKRARAGFTGKETTITERATVGELSELLKALPAETILDWRVRTEAVADYHLDIQAIELHTWRFDRHEDGTEEHRLVIESTVRFPTYDRLHPAFWSAVEGRQALKRSLNQARRWAKKIEETLAALEEEDERGDDQSSAPLT